MAGVVVGWPMTSSVGEASHPEVGHIPGVAGLAKQIPRDPGANGLRGGACHYVSPSPPAHSTSSHIDIAPPQACSPSPNRFPTVHLLGCGDPAAEVFVTADIPVKAAFLWSNLPGNVIRHGRRAALFSILFSVRNLIQRGRWHQDGHPISSGSCQDVENPRAPRNRDRGRLNRMTN